jgi:hypothetical protein
MRKSLKPQDMCADMLGPLAGGEEDHGLDGAETDMLARPAFGGVE